MFVRLLGGLRNTVGHFPFAAPVSRRIRSQARIYDDFLVIAHPIEMNALAAMSATSKCKFNKWCFSFQPIDTKTNN